MIAKSTQARKRLAARRRRENARWSAAAALCLAVLALAACTKSLDLFDSSSKVDRSIATGTIAGGPVQQGGALSDEATVQNAVTSADLDKLDGQPLPWANAATGSAGVISAIRQSQQSGLICRDFSTTRHGYDGIANFTGRACIIGKQGGWGLTAFERQ